MLDAYIIERIRRQREERHDGEREPLRIEVPLDQVPPSDRDRDEDDRPNRSTVIIDFQF